MKRYIATYLIFLTLPFLVAFDEVPGYKKKFSVLCTNDFFTTDYLGNIYAAKGDELIKFNISGEKLRIYSNKKLGNIFSVDASNPLRILVYYKDFSCLVILDSQLSPNGDGVHLEEFNLEQTDLACTSFNNGVWVFNRQNMELVRLDESMQKVISTGNLNRILNLDLHPNFMLEYNGNIYLNDPASGILIFDMYGTYAKTIPLMNLLSFQVREGVFYFFQEGKFTAYYPREFRKVQEDFSEINFSQIRIEKDRIYLGNSDSILVCTAIK